MDLVGRAFAKGRQDCAVESIAGDLVWKPCNDDAVLNRNRKTENVSESQIGCDYRRVVDLGIPGNVIVGSPSQAHVSNILDVKIVGTEQSSQRPRQILIDEKPRGLPHGPNLLVAESACRVGKRRQDILSCELVFLHDLFYGQATAELADNEIYRDSRARYHWLSEPDLLIHGDPGGNFGHSFPRLGRPEADRPVGKCIPSRLLTREHALLSIRC